MYYLGLRGTLARPAGHAQEGQCGPVRWLAGAFWHMCFTPPILIHSTMPGWTSEIQIQIHCDIPHVTCMLFGRVSCQPPCEIFTCLGCTSQTCIPTVHAVQSHFWNDRVWRTLPQEDLVECSLVIFTSPSEFSCLAQPSL